MWISFRINNQPFSEICRGIKELLKLGAVEVKLQQFFQIVVLVLAYKWYLLLVWGDHYEAVPERVSPTVSLPASVVSTAGSFVVSVDVPLPLTSPIGDSADSPLIGSRVPS